MEDLMDGLKFGWEQIAIDRIRLETIISGEDPYCYNEKLYLLKKTEIFDEQASLLLLRLHPIFVIRKKSLYWVVAGSRSFAVAAASLYPKKEIWVAMLDNHTTEEQLQHLRYYDLAITPLMLSFDGSASDIYNYCNSAKPEQKNSLPLLNSSLRSFAKALDKSPSALCVPKSTGDNKRNPDVAKVTDE